MDKKMMKVLVISIIGAIILGGIYWAWQMSSNPASQTVQDESNTTDTTQTNDANSNGATQKPSTLSYTAAVKLYGDRRIQFNETCGVEPEYVTFKKGTTIMLDNRGSKARTISLDSQKYNLSAYGFKIITLTTSSPLPHTIMIDCGTGQNNGRILLQQ